ncbi:unnamed protein product [Oreochromis niloticus]|nr:unnamed protein product [Mustela putorius furo]
MDVMRGSQLGLLNEEVRGIGVSSPDGRMLLMPLCVEQLRQMTVQCFMGLLLLWAMQKCLFQGYTKDDVKLLVDGTPLDDYSAPVTDYGIKPGSTVQMVIKVHGG